MKFFLRKKNKNSMPDINQKKSVPDISQIKIERKPFIVIKEIEPDKSSDDKNGESENNVNSNSNDTK